MSVRCTKFEEEEHRINDIITAANNQKHNFSSLIGRREMEHKKVDDDSTYANTSMKMKAQVNKDDQAFLQRKCSRNGCGEIDSEHKVEDIKPSRSYDFKSYTPRGEVFANPKKIFTKGLSYTPNYFYGAKRLDTHCISFDTQPGRVDYQTETSNQNYVFSSPV